MIPPSSGRAKRGPNIFFATIGMPLANVNSANNCSMCKKCMLAAYPNRECCAIPHSPPPSRDTQKAPATNRARFDCSDRVVDYCCCSCSLSLHLPYCCLARISRRARMNPGARSLILTESQAACLVALRLRKESKTEIAIRAKLDLKKAAMALDALQELG